ncbi:hypothetical protein GRI44_07270 [Altererythrobacter confluentis]|uniref:Uncharacterized protein n=1 Tax=Allopontixanthobacter confluentis TaxID=1849021 RepID=A0A6L7GF67_9SPHN|nr:hypothetical protein [Allopontixanthobacter confluentis]MXP14547.1 hypothetical protein [Allopontixanthobacter confluentis]
MNERNVVFFRDYSRRSRHSVQADDLDFYLAYHATMVVAGKLLERLPAYENPTDPLDDYRTYSSWLGDQMLVRSDGYWLFDRRDPWPVYEDIDWAAEKDEDWLASIKNYDVQHLVFPSPEKVAIWGYWTERYDRREQTVMVRSALVSPSNADALVRAVGDQGHYDFVLPSFEDFGEIDEGQFVLKGWVTEEGRHDGLDANDPWAAEMSKRVDVPQEEFRDKLRAKSKDLGRKWGSGKGELFWSEVWSEAEEQSTWRQSGDRLLANRIALQDLIASTGRSIVLEVFVERRINRREYESAIESGGNTNPFKREFFIVENGDD